MNQANLSKLTDGSYESCYWLGFLLADGHFSKRNRLEVELSLKDEDHLKKYATYIEFRGDFHYRRRSCMAGVSDHEMVPRICAQYGIHSNKTCHPPEHAMFEGLTDLQIVCLFIGFIDGDGSLTNDKGRRNTCNLSLAGHKNSLSLLTYFVSRVAHASNIGIAFPTIRQTKRGDYAQFQVRNHALNKFLKQTALDLKLPIMDRKWRQIDMKLVTGTERRKMFEPEIRKMLSEQTPVSIIASKLGVKDWFIYNLIKDRKLQTV